MTGRNTGVPAVHALIALAALLTVAGTLGAQSLFPPDSSAPNPLRPTQQNSPGGARSNFTTPAQPVAAPTPATLQPVQPLPPQPQALAPAGTNTLSPAPAPVTPAASEVSVPTAGDKLTPTELENRRKQAEAATDLPEETKKKIAELYRQAGEHLQQTQQQAAIASEHKTATETVAQRVATLQQELKQLEQGRPAPPSASSLGELEQQLSAADLKQKELKAALTKLEAEPAARAVRRKELRELLLGSPQRREEIKKQLDAAPPADESPHLTLARRTEALARKNLIEAQTPAFNNELARYDAEESSDMLRMQRDRVARQIVQVQKEFEQLTAAVARRREMEAEAAVRQAQEEVIYAQPVLKSHAEENQALAEQGQELAKLISETEGKLQRARQRLEDVQRQMTQMQTKVDSVGLTGAIGLMLRKQRAELPDVRKRRENVKNRRELIDAVQLALFEYDDQRSDLSTPEPIVAEIVRSAGVEGQSYELARLREATEQVLLRKRDYLDTLIRSHSTYFDAMVELDTTERQLISVTEGYQNYIDQRVLWIRSARPLHADFSLDETDYQLVSGPAWTEVARICWPT